MDSFTICISSAGNTAGVMEISKEDFINFANSLPPVLRKGLSFAMLRLGERTLMNQINTRPPIRLPFYRPPVTISQE